MMRQLIAFVAGVLAASQVAAAQPTADGRRLFAERCAACHGENGWATRVLSRRVPPGEGMLEKRSELAAEFVRAMVRTGIGMMPPIRRAELRDSDLAAIAAYLQKGNSQ